MKLDAILNLTNRIFTGLFKLILFGFFARYIGVESFGTLVLFVSIFTVVSQIINFGTEYSILNNNLNFSFKEYLSFFLIKFLIVTILIYLFLTPVFGIYTAITISLFISTQMLFFVSQTIFLKFNKYLIFSIWNMIINVLPLITLILYVPKDEIDSLLIMSITKLPLVLYLCVFFDWSFKRHIKELFKMYNNSFKYIIFEQSKFIHHRLDIIILSSFGNNYSAGLLGAIKNFVEFTQYIPKTLQVIIYKYSDNQNKIITFSYILISVLFALIFLALIFTKDYFIVLVYGDKFSNIDYLLLYSMIGSYLYSLSYVNMSVIVSRSNSVNKLNILIVVIYSILYIILGYFHALIGVIFAFIIASLIYFLITIAILYFIKGGKQIETIT